MKGGLFEIIKGVHWRRSSLCKEVDMGKLTNTSKVFLTVQHGNDPADTVSERRRFHIESWIEHTKGLAGNVRVCVRSMEVFSATKKHIFVHWLVVHPDKLSTNDPRAQVMKDVSFQLTQANTRTSSCRNLTDAEPNLAGYVNMTIGAPEPVMMVGVKTRVPGSEYNDVSKQKFAVPLATWTEESHDDNNVNTTSTQM